jgi:hypothetical protein
VARRLLLWLAYLFAVLAFFEGSARLALGNRTFYDRIFSGDSTTYRLSWLERRASSGSPTTYPIDEFSPTLGWKLKPNLRDVDAFRGKLVNSNARGLRGRREFGYAKPPGVFRILVLGDSFAFGDDVGDEDAFPHVLQELLPQVEVLNLGVHGYGHDQMLLYLQEEGLRYQPDLVLLGFLPLDMGRNILAFRDYAKPRFVLRDGKLVLTHSPVPSVEETLAAERYGSRFLDLIRILEARLRSRSGAAARETKELTLAILDEIRAEAEAAGARAVYAYLPAFAELTHPDPSKTPDERFFFDYCENRGIPAIYLRPYFLSKLELGFEFEVWDHWSEFEHRIAAEGIAAELLARGLMPMAGVPRAEP